MKMKAKYYQKIREYKEKGYKVIKVLILKDRIGLILYKNNKFYYIEEY